MTDGDCQCLVDVGNGVVVCRCARAETRKRSGAVDWRRGRICAGAESRPDQRGLLPTRTLVRAGWRFTASMYHLPPLLSFPFFCQRSPPHRMWQKAGPGTPFTTPTFLPIRAPSLAVSSAITHGAGTPNLPPRHFPRVIWYSTAVASNFRRPGTTPIHPHLRGRHEHLHRVGTAAHYRAHCTPTSCTLTLRLR
ncbi:hypothetical protein M427DRAFT_439658 [Gonapodya prolifera JEL478]|uniref:Uncharacterized protein n=1 Tax=Gonapodya prolifera (strain JEL478) TaxID=1344416 RepID=A0A139A3J3_GONPJ|nr:hypothetical protein M427DRAFT_439658 [Gonapodya prolifera JEL478]|eukprot:KXS11386.1 hypothetical protein M427DRAFT_439658 [Gonapodya prolifera JEL478]